MGVHIKASEFEELIGKLSSVDKVSFYELLACNLTIANRDCLSNEETSDELKVHQMKFLNEILHRIISKSRVERLQLHEWSEYSIIEMLTHYIKQEPSIGLMVSWAIENAYEGLSIKEK